METIERLFRHPETGAEIIATNETHADAFKTVGFVEVEEEEPKRKKKTAE